MYQTRLWDCHMHSSFSGDSTSPMEQMIESAQKKGLAGICFTEHLDPDYPQGPDDLDFSLDIPAYAAKLQELKMRFQDKLEIHLGIELGLQPHLASYFHRVVQEADFDFIIGSSHTVHKKDPYYPSFYEGRDQTDCYREYFDSILENLKAFSDMDVYGHLDYVVRYGPSRNEGYHYRQFQEVLDEILKKLVHLQIGLEVNTGGYAYGLGSPNPSKEIICRYRELGGEIITLGADAHSPERIACSFDLAEKLLVQCGFRYYTVFRKRIPSFLPLR